MLGKEEKTIIAAGDPRELRNSDDVRVRDFFTRKSEDPRAHGGP
jgi:ABC-type transporter Mla maintaining outer membrane lipid asymmetry ATPase subunit MlaF